MRLIVRPRHALPKLDLDEPYVVVSITDPPTWSTDAYVSAVWSPNLVAWLQLRFFDVGEDHPQRMTEANANELAALLGDHPTVGTVVISCDAAGSRSPSVAFAIADHLRLPRSCIDWRPEHVHGDPPNVWVYDKVREGMVRWGKHHP